MTTYCIIDDEPIAHRIIEGYCAELSNLQKAGNAYDAFEASVMVTQQKVDLIFLDINMPKMTGFEWLKTVPHPPKIIVTTAYKEYALEGYELDIIDYLLKPFSLSRFLKAINKAISTDKGSSLGLTHTHSTQDSYFFLKGDRKHHHIRVGDILCIEAFGNYTKVFLSEEMIVSHEKISAMEALLSADNFLRVHKSYIVAIDRIKHIQGNVIYLHDHKVPIGQSYKSRISQLLASR